MLRWAQFSVPKWAQLGPVLIAEYIGLPSVTKRSGRAADNS
jgi:hypothetical protein